MCACLPSNHANMKSEIVRKFVNCPKALVAVLKSLSAVQPQIRNIIKKELPGGEVSPLHKKTIAQFYGIELSFDGIKLNWGLLFKRNLGMFHLSLKLVSLSRIPRIESVTLNLKAIYNESEKFSLPTALSQLRRQASMCRSFLEGSI